MTVPEEAIFNRNVIHVIAICELSCFPLTSFPNFVPISSDTLAATLIAATRRGCVHPIFSLPLVKP